MSDLVAFLVACLDDDEATARAVAKPLFDGDAFSLRFSSWESDHSRGDEAFVDRFDPARVLVEVDAKRRIVERVGGVEVGYPSYHLAQGVLRLLVLPYVGRPGFDERWLPDGA